MGEMPIGSTNIEADHRCRGRHPTCDHHRKIETKSHGALVSGLELKVDERRQLMYSQGGDHQHERQTARPSPAGGPAQPGLRHCSFEAMLDKCRPERPKKLIGDGQDKCNRTDEKQPNSAGLGPSEIGDEPPLSPPVRHQGLAMQLTDRSTAVLGNFRST
jgi:hypothetical protein